MLLLHETSHITDLHGFGSPSRAVSLLRQLINFQFFWVIVCSLLCATEPATGPYPVSFELVHTSYCFFFFSTTLILSFDVFVDGLSVV